MKKSRSSSKTSTAKAQALRESGTLNTGATKVQDRLFLEESFFDPQDLTQVKYEMLRRVRKETMPIGHAAISFGFSRPVFYKAQQDFARDGLAGLIPKRRGPKRAHKLTAEILGFVERARDREPSIRIPELVRQIQKEFALQVHRRSLERALAAAKKKTEPAIVCDERARQMQSPAMLSEHYEMLRAYVLAQSGSGPRLGQGVLMARGMAAWMEVVGELIRPVRSAPSGEAVSVPLFVQSDVIQLMGEAVMTLVCRGSL